MPLRFPFPRPHSHEPPQPTPQPAWLPERRLPGEQSVDPMETPALAATLRDGWVVRPDRNALAQRSVSYYVLFRRHLDGRPDPATTGHVSVDGGNTSLLPQVWCADCPQYPCVHVDVIRARLDVF